MIRTPSVFYHHGKRELVVAREGPDFHKTILAADLESARRAQVDAEAWATAERSVMGLVTIMQSGHDVWPASSPSEPVRHHHFRTYKMHQNSATILKVALIRLMYTVRLPD